MANVQGRVQTLLDDLVGSGIERGVQVAAYQAGQLVVDAWAGVADAATGRLVDGETLFTVFSATKGITATVIHLLADRGQLDYDDAIAGYWPAFGAHGKDRVTVRHALTHTAGIPQLWDGVTPADMCDWERMCRAIADLTPLWQPGTRTGYHAATYGYILGEVARRVDGRPIAQIVQDEICSPLGITTLYFGIPDEMESRVAVLESAALSDETRSEETPPPPDVLTPAALYSRAMPPTLGSLEELFNRPDVRRASIPAGGGIMNARALARHYAVLACGELDGVRLLTPERIRLASTLQIEDVDLVDGVPVRRALGYMLGGLESKDPLGGRITVFGHGAGRQMVGFADPEQRFALGVTKNRMRWSEDTTYRIAREVRDALGIPESG
ncbi:MAG TPA: serine hydrolase domain-containing protein [Chloroflexota bacterium]|nr:serine hydrolase domain-containing protein [Chloroflexota bacterium]